MEFVIWIIVIVLAVALVWWLLNRRGSGQDGGAAHQPPASGDRPGEEREPSGGALSHGSLAGPSAEAAATAGIPGAAGYGSASPSTPPVTPDDEHDAAVAHSAGAGKAPAHNADRPEAASSTGNPDAESSAGEGDVDDWTTGTAAGPAAGTPAATAPATGSTPGRDQQPRSAPNVAGASSLETAPPETQGRNAGPVFVEREPALSGNTESTAVDSSTTNPSTEEELSEENRESERRAAEERAAEDKAEWESQWSDVEGKPTPPPSGHHDGYTSPQAPTLPGAETAAAEALEDAPESAAPAGHLAVGQPYGEGSASPEPDGSGPAGYTVKGDASNMVYYDETDPGYEEAVCNVWFLSPAHAEAAGFREPRRMRR